ncbi:MAG: bifunctional folylpolyglutamate synthase/dihydrofolate synthase, partial [Roseiflexaceae bacterium]|nr:bifunctional folylpolyglutamate synthase/dihydrofolate synthase [Roseiflexaceae bacterium]
MNYQETLDYLYTFLDSEANLPRRSTEFNLPRTRALLDAVGAPDRALRCVVIAGTKGKGSTAALLEAILRAGGYRTGLWTSPHLHTYRERIQVDRMAISREQLIELVARFRPTIDAFDAAQYGLPSVFEVGFALALCWFTAQRVDLVVLEVGLGGRYDSANAVEPILSIITSISYDHTAILGETLGAIAYQKAGIARAGVPLLTGPQPPDAQAMIAQVAAEVGAQLVVAGAVGAGAKPLSLR